MGKGSAPGYLESTFKGITRKTSEKEMAFTIGQLGADTKVSLIGIKMEGVLSMKEMEHGKRDSTRTIYEKENCS